VISKRFLNPSAAQFEVPPPSEKIAWGFQQAGKKKGGWGGKEFLPACFRSEAPPPRSSEQSNTKKFSFPFRRKNPARAKRKCRENFFAEQRAKRAAAGRSVSFVQKRFAQSV